MGFQKSSSPTPCPVGTETGPGERKSVLRGKNADQNPFLLQVLAVFCHEYFFPPYSNI